MDHSSVLLHLFDDVVLLCVLLLVDVCGLLWVLCVDQMGCSEGQREQIKVTGYGYT
ncbi:hypothetical protein IJ674_10005 [bacterium]|nr:hypothetical protein [bacterium]